MKLTKIIILSLGLFLSFGVPTSNATIPPDLPPQVTQGSTTLLFFFWGYLDGVDEIGFLDEIGGHYSLRLIAAVIRSQITLFAAHPYSVAYLYGRQIAYEREADRRGEP